MLGNAPFGFGLLRIYTALMGSCVDNIYIQRSLSSDYESSPSEDQLILVPVSYSCKDNIYIERSLSPDYTPDPSESELIKVPVEYSNKDKMLTRLMSDPNIDRPYSTLLPRIAFEMMDMRYDGDRKQPSMNYTSYLNSDNALFNNMFLYPIIYILTYMSWRRMLSTARRSLNKSFLFSRQNLFSTLLLYPDERNPERTNSSQKRLLRR